MALPLPIIEPDQLLAAYTTWLANKQADALDDNENSPSLVVAVGAAGDGLIMLPHKDGWTIPEPEACMAMGRLGYPCDALFIGYSAGVEVIADTFTRPPVLRTRNRVIPHTITWMFDITMQVDLALLLNMETGQMVDVTEVAYEQWRPRFKTACLDALSQPLADNESSSRRMARADLRRMTKEGRLDCVLKKPGTFRRIVTGVGSDAQV